MRRKRSQVLESPNAGAGRGPPFACPAAQALGRPVTSHACGQRLAAARVVASRWAHLARCAPEAEAGRGGMDWARYVERKWSCERVSLLLIMGPHGPSNPICWQRKSSASHPFPGHWQSDLVLGGSLGRLAARRIRLIHLPARRALARKQDTFPARPSPQQIPRFHGHRQSSAPATAPVNRTTTWVWRPSASCMHGRSRC